MSPRDAWILLAVLSCSGAAAQDVAPPPAPASPPPCKLLRLSELDLVTQPNGLISVPASIDDHTVFLEVDTGDIRSIVTSTVADSLHLDRDRRGMTFSLLGA